MLGSWTKTEIVSESLNKELAAYGLKTSFSSDKRRFFMDEKGMSQVTNFFKSRAHQPVLKPEHTERVRILVDYANKNKIDPL